MGSRVIRYLAQPFLALLSIRNSWGVCKIYICASPTLTDSDSIGGEDIIGRNTMNYFFFPFPFSIASMIFFSLRAYTWGRVGEINEIS